MYKKQTMKSLKQVDSIQVLSYTLVYAQEFVLEIEFAKALRGTETISSKDFEIDSEGNVYVVGHFSEILRLNPDSEEITMESDTFGDQAFVAKYSSKLMG